MIATTKEEDVKGRNKDDRLNYREYLENNDVHNGHLKIEL